MVIGGSLDSRSFFLRFLWAIGFSSLFFFFNLFFLYIYIYVICLDAEKTWENRKKQRNGNFEPGISYRGSMAFGAEGKLGWVEFCVMNCLIYHALVWWYHMGSLFFIFRWLSFFCNPASDSYFLCFTHRLVSVDCSSIVVCFVLLVGISKLLIAMTQCILFFHLITVLRSIWDGLIQKNFICFLSLNSEKTHKNGIS